MHMLKRLFTLTTLMLLMTTIGYADTITVSNYNLPNVQAGTVYSIQDKEFKAATTVTALSYDTKIGTIELRGGYVLDKEPIGALTFKVGDLTQYGINMPLHNLINVSVGGYLGYDFSGDADKSIDNIDYGLIGTVIDVKF